VIRDSIERAFKGEDKGGSLHAQLEGFKTVLLHSLTHEQFADMYAQTICYGLFAAKCNKQDSNISRRDVAYDLPKTNPFLRKMFGYMAGPDLHTGVVWAVEDLINLLNHADFHAFLSDFGKRTRRQDPIVHFYETFLAAYDPKLRETRGVYYTPEPVVSYIVRSIDHILKTDFGIKDGLADRTKIPIYETVTDKNGKKSREKTGECHKVLILDPAVGTGSFLYGVIEHIHEHIVAKGQAGAWSNYVYDDLLPRLFGFELLMAPYAIAHLKLGLQLAETGYKPPKDKKQKRLGIYLTNSLEEAHSVQATLPFANFIAEEANAATDVKQDKPVMVILGNPPYSGHSENKGKWITRLIDDYKAVQGKKIRLGQAKWLQNDYVKFLRYAQYRIESTGYGIAGMITDHSYVDSGTFVGMRANLKAAFDQIHVLDLQGNAKRNANRSDKDVNVFDITQGVAICLAVKREQGHTSDDVLVAELRGSRKAKYEYLLKNSVADTQWQDAACYSPYYLLAESSSSNLDEYGELLSIRDIMPGSYLSDEARRVGTGFVTTHDSFAIGFSEPGIERKVQQFLDTTTESEARGLFRLCSQSQWNYSLAHSTLSRQKWKQSIRIVLYRPMDLRRTVWDKHVCVHRRLDVHRHLDQANMMLCVGQAGNVVGADEWALVYVSSTPVDFNLFYRGGCATLPLYLYPNGDLFDNGETSDAPGGRRPNLNAEFIKDVAKKVKLKFIADGVGDLKKTFGPENIFHYMYAVFHSPTYRSRYAEFLKIDFPRLPLTTKRPLFRTLCGLGSELVGLHLMEQHGPPLARLEKEGDMLVEMVRYTDEIAEIAAASTRNAWQTPRNDAQSGGKVWINQTQYFGGVPREVWEFHVGGYQVCHKWLKDRKGRTLSIDDIDHYQHVVSALSETIRLMTEIDTTIDKHGGWPIQ
jgi:predicted helicase